MKNNFFLKGMKFYNTFDTTKWNFVLNKVKKIINSYGYKEIIFPTLWNNNLFKFIGNESSILKQMYSLQDSKNNIISLRPEGTSICTKLFLYNIKKEQKTKWWYFCTMFRHENPQLGRYREFYQLGLESFGYNSIGIDIELMIIINKILIELNINKFLNLEINYIGSKKTLNKYKEYLINFIKNNLNLFKNTNYLSLYKNPFNILNIKNFEFDILSKLLSIKKFLEKDEILKFNKFIKLLDNNNINYKINNFLFRGINYYSETIFEYTTKFLGRKISICSGGRYSELINNLSNKFNIPAVGLAIGWNRLMLIYNKLNDINNNNIDYDIYITMTNKNFLTDTINFSEKIRNILPNIKLFVDYSISNIKNKIRFILKKKIKISLIMYKNIYNKKIIYKNLKTNEYLINNKKIILNKLILFFN